MTFDELIHLGLQQGASDWHLSPGQPVALRIDGEIRKAELRCEPAWISQPLERVETHRAEAFIRKDEHSLDAGYRHEATNLRLHFFRSEARVCLKARKIAKEIPTMEQLGLPPGFVDLIRRPSPNGGLILVAGQTSSGKSTTLASAIADLNRRQTSSIITLEHPIEFTHEPALCQIEQREVGVDVASFAQGVVDAMREDPDVILIGEMRDRETVRAALSAAETGHLVLGTLHTRTAPKTVDRLLESLPAEDRDRYGDIIASSLLAVLCQRLLPSRNGGRVAAFELMRSTPAVANKIRERKFAQLRAEIAGGAQQQMLSMDASLGALLRQKKISYEVALANAEDAEAFRREHPAR